MISISSFDDMVAAEHGRLLAARALAASIEKRHEMEELMGRDYLRRRYPEAYSSGFGSLLDKLKRLL